MAVLHHVYVGEVIERMSSLQRAPWLCLPCLQSLPHTPAQSAGTRGWKQLSTDCPGGVTDPEYPNGVVSASADAEYGHFLSKKHQYCILTFPSFTEKTANIFHKSSEIMTVSVLSNSLSALQRSCKKTASKLADVGEQIQI